MVMMVMQEFCCGCHGALPRTPRLLL